MNIFRKLHFHQGLFSTSNNIEEHHTYIPSLFYQIEFNLVKSDTFCAFFFLCTLFCFSWTEPNVLMNFSNCMLLFRLSKFPVPATQIWRASDRSVELESGLWTKLTRSMTILLEISVISDLFWWKK